MYIVTFDNLLGCSGMNEFKTRGKLTDRIA